MTSLPLYVSKTSGSVSGTLAQVPPLPFRNEPGSCHTLAAVFANSRQRWELILTHLDLLLVEPLLLIYLILDIHNHVIVSHVLPFLSINECIVLVMPCRTWTL